MKVKDLAKRVEPSLARKDSLSTPKSRYADVFTRIIYSILMLLIFLSIMSAGIVAGVIVALFVVVTMFSEITKIDRDARMESQLPWGRPLKIYFFVCSTALCLFLGLEELFLISFPKLEDLHYILPIIEFCCPILGFIVFIISLKRGFYKYQIVRLIWTVMSLIVIESQFYFELRNMVRGMIWFLLPVFCVIVNDSWAYICGKLFGRTPLLLLSPKKTVEGFIGALLVTVLWSFWFCGFLSHFPSLHCPAIRFASFERSSCAIHSIFIPKEFSLPPWIQWLSGYQYSTLSASEAQLHALVLGAVASLIAPFGGFFASALKRSFHLKDFGNLIPGHGGMTDRMDCQGLMAICTFFYLETFVFQDDKQYEKALQSALLLSPESRAKLCKDLSVC